MTDTDPRTVAELAEAAAAAGTVGRAVLLRELTLDTHRGPVRIPLHAIVHAAGDRREGRLIVSSRDVDGRPVVGRITRGAEAAPVDVPAFRDRLAAAKLDARRRGAAHGVTIGGRA